MTQNFIPSYIKLYSSGIFAERIQLLQNKMQNCDICPQNCLADRTAPEFGKCLSGDKAIVSSYTAHFGEEPVISGRNGAGNIFFGNCNLKCIYCQNHEISQSKSSKLMKEVSDEELADIMIKLQETGCHNIGLVSPTHFGVQILNSIYIAIEKGLSIPIVYNSNGYDSVEMLKLFHGVIDIYLPDLKYGSDIYSKELSKCPDYFEFAKLALQEMYSQIGHEHVLEEGLLKRGLIVRHLVLPNDLSESESALKFIADLNPEIYISLMSQYFPDHKAVLHPLLGRKIRHREYEKVLEFVEKIGLHNGWIQEPESADTYRPYFYDSRENPFRN